MSWIACGECTSLFDTDEFPHLFHEKTQLWLCENCFPLEDQEDKENADT